eukprot:scaffold54264_cov26-Tisochrysis_lutea.AAC.3
MLLHRRARIRRQNKCVYVRMRWRRRRRLCGCWQRGHVGLPSNGRATADTWTGLIFLGRGASTTPGGSTTMNAVVVRAMPMCPCAICVLQAVDERS